MRSRVTRVSIQAGRWCLECLIRPCGLESFPHYVIVVSIRDLLDVKVWASSWVYVAMLVPLVRLLVAAWRTMKWRLAFLVCIMLISVMYLPYVMDVMLLYNMPARVHVAAPLSAAMMWGIFINNSSVSASGRKWVVSMCIAAVVCAMYAVGANARNQMYICEVAKTELQHMYMRGIETAGQSGLRGCRIVISGKPVRETGNNVGSCIWGMTCSDQVIVPHLFC